MKPEIRDAGDDGIEKRSKALLDESIEHLDGRTLSRLTRARHAALDEAQRARHASLRRWWVPATGLAATAVLAVMIGQGRREPVASPVADGSLLDDFEIVADADNLDMLEDVEFYSWLPEDPTGS
ncbi:MAG TPA: hypothetical protein VGN07_11870 [Steroidobacteraceae bacterium]